MPETITSSETTEYRTETNADGTTVSTEYRESETEIPASIPDVEWNNPQFDALVEQVRGLQDRLDSLQEVTVSLSERIDNLMTTPTQPAAPAPLSTEPASPIPSPPTEGTGQAAVPLSATEGSAPPAAPAASAGETVVQPTAEIKPPKSERRKVGWFF